MVSDSIAPSPFTITRSMPPLPMAGRREKGDLGALSGFSDSVQRWVWAASLQGASCLLCMFRWTWGKKAPQVQRGSRGEHCRLSHNTRIMFLVCCKGFGKPL